MVEHDWRDVREELLTDPEVRREVERDAFAHEVALWILRYRTEHGWSQRELARRVGVKQPVIARLEAGETEPKVSTLARLAEALGTDLVIRVAAHATLAAPRVGIVPTVAL
jgi:transcriptional regulator with XRE-family HTH domain